MISKLASIVANTALKAACLVSSEMGISLLWMASRKLIRAGVVPANFSMTETILVMCKLAYAKGNQIQYLLFQPSRGENGCQGGAVLNIELWYLTKEFQ